jgi:hypothetical protein
VTLPVAREVHRFAALQCQRRDAVDLIAMLTRRLSLKFGEALFSSENR